MDFTCLFFFLATIQFLVTIDQCSAEYDCGKVPKVDIHVGWFPKVTFIWFNYVYVIHWWKTCCKYPKMVDPKVIGDVKAKMGKFDPDKIKGILYTCVCKVLSSSPSVLTYLFISNLNRNSNKRSSKNWILSKTAISMSKKLSHTLKITCKTILIGRKCSKKLFQNATKESILILLDCKNHLNSRNKSATWNSTISLNAWTFLALQWGFWILTS